VDCQTPAATILIVTGSELRAEEMDRPLAYYLRQKIVESEAFVRRGPIHVISDYRYLYEKKFADYPTISIGGPGVNALAHKWLEKLPLCLTVDDEFFLQMTPPGQTPVRASIFGVDHETTQFALATFLENHLDGFLAHCHPESARAPRA
jgi:hypothetical protein